MHAAGLLSQVVRIAGFDVSSSKDACAILQFKPNDFASSTCFENSWFQEISDPIKIVAISQSSTTPHSSTLRWQDDSASDASQSKPNCLANLRWGLVSSASQYVLSSKISVVFSHSLAGVQLAGLVSQVSANA